MNIGVDIDGVLIDCDKYVFDYLSRFLYKNNLPKMDNPDAFEEKYVLSGDIKTKFRDEFWYGFYMKNAEPQRFACEVLKELKKRGHKITVITGRFWKYKESNPELYKKLKTITFKWFKKNKIPYDELCFVSVPKTPEIEQRHIDLMLEDSMESIPELVKITKVACFNATYNREFNHKNLIRVYSWYDFLAKFDENFGK